MALPPKFSSQDFAIVMRDVILKRHSSRRQRETEANLIKRVTW